MKKPRKASAALAVGSLLAGAGAITISLTSAEAAGAARVPVSKDFTYSCDLPLLGATPFDVTVSADVPQSVTTGAPIHVDSFQTVVTTPANVTAVLSALGVAFVQGDPQATPPGGALVTNEINDNGVTHESTFQAAVPLTPVPSDGATPLVTTATATVPDYTTTGAGSVVLGSGPFTVTLHGTKADGSDAGQDALLHFTCTQPTDATLATVAVMDTTSLSISAPSSVNYGGTAKLSTVLKDTTTNKALSGARAVLQRRANASKPWSTVGTVTTSSTGVATRSLKPTANAQYRWNYAGDATHTARTSSAKSVSVAQVVGIHTTRTSFRHGGTVRIWGSVKPAGAGQKVTLQHLVGRTWRSGASVVLKKQKMPNGSTTVGYVFTVKEPAKGTFKFRVHKAATSALAQGTSSTVTLKVT